MEVAALIIVIFGALYAVRGAGRGLSRAYTSRRDSWDAKHPKASWLHRRAALAGYLATMLRHGGPALLAGAKEGWRDGVAEGHSRIQQWRPGTLSEDRDVPDSYGGPAPAPDLPPPDSAKPGTVLTKPATDPPAGAKPSTGRRRRPAPAADDGPAPPADWAALNKGDRPGPSPEPEDPTLGSPGPQKPAPDKPAPDDTPEEYQVAEVVNVETLLAVLQEKAKRAATDADDAVKAHERATNEAGTTEVILGSMRRHKFTQAHIDMVAALRDPETQAVEACLVRRSAAANVHTAASRAAEMAAKHVQMKADGAAGAVYQG